MRKTSACAAGIGLACAAALYFATDVGSQDIRTPLPHIARSPAANPTTPGKVALGRLAAFQRSIVANNAPFDRYMRGDRTAMNASQLAGMRRFERVGCANCHNGPMFSDYKLHALGGPDNPTLPTDPGAEGRYAFRTASLRNLRFTAPYMHSGIFNTLEDVLEFYDDVDNVAAAAAADATTTATCT